MVGFDDCRDDCAEFFDGFFGGQGALFPLAFGELESFCCGAAFLGVRDEKFSDVDLEVIGELLEVFHLRGVDALEPAVEAHCAHSGD